ncbi:ATP-dependent zinc metalloprotease FtsH [Chitinophagales bacterium]|nr:ATP-dependent zinc metalloprotease FtsH [Chitinophagales bacterium]
MSSKKDEGGFNPYWIYAILGVLLVISLFLSGGGAENNKVITQNYFVKEMLLANDVKKVVVVNDNQVEVYLKEEALENNEKYAELKESKGFFDSYHAYFTIANDKQFAEDMNELEDKHPEIEDLRIEYEQRESIMDTLIFFLPILLFVFIFFFFMRRMGGGVGGGNQIFNIGKSKATLFDQNSKSQVTFKDVAGLGEAKEEVMEIVSFLKEPAKYTRLGGKIPKGALLIGAPGTGKTLLAKAMAGEAKVPFFSISGSDFVEMFVGVGASRVRDLFKQAREKAPCIIFVDEIDAIGRARGKNIVQGGNDERENTLNQLLVEMDGFGSEKGIILIAATNRPDVLDPALLRPGRFDRQIHVDRPDLKEREEIFKVHIKNIKLAKDLDISKLAALTPGFVGADIANICNEAALIAARNNKDAIELEDFNAAIDRVIGGLEKKNKIISPDEKKRIAYHEAGHAVSSWFLKHANPLVKVTVVPRGQSLGAAWYTPNERNLTTKEQMLDQMAATLAGRAAEQLIFGEISTGAQNDLDKVTSTAYSMVVIYGMTEKVGNVSYYELMKNETFQKPYSDETARVIDEEVKQIIDKEYDRVLALLKEKSEELHKVAQVLLEKEVIVKDDMVELIGERPFEETKPIPEVKEESAPANENANTQQLEDSNPSEDEKPAGEA